MSWQSILNATKTDTPDRLKFRQVERPPSTASVPVVFGTKLVRGRYVELEKIRQNYLSVAINKGVKVLAESDYDPAQTNPICDRLIDAVGRYREQIEIPEPLEQQILYGNPASSLSRQTVGSITRTVIDPLMSYNITQFPEPFARLVNAVAVWAFYTALRFGRSNAGTTEIEYRLATQAAGGREPVFMWLDVLPIVLAAKEADSANLTPHAINVSRGYLDVFRYLLGVQQSYLSLIAAFELAYYDISQLENSLGVNRTVHNVLKELATYRTKIMGMMGYLAYFIYLTGEEAQKLSFDTGDGSYETVTKYLRNFFVWTLKRATMSVPHASAGRPIAVDDVTPNVANIQAVGDFLNLIRFGAWEKEFLNDLRLDLCALGGRSIRQKFYSGASVLCQGELDKVQWLAINDIKLPQQFKWGWQDVYYPLALGGFDGSGGIGSFSNKMLGIWPGSADQIINLQGKNEDRRSYHYRHLACVTFDEYNLGGTDTPVNFSALVTLITKNSDGDVRWNLPQARISTIPADLPNTPINQYLYIVIDSKVFGFNDLIPFFRSLQELLPEFVTGIRIQSFQNKAWDVLQTRATFLSTDFASTSNSWMTTLSNASFTSGSPLSQAEFDRNWTRGTCFMLGNILFSNKIGFFHVGNAFAPYVAQSWVWEGRDSRDDEFYASQNTLNPIHIIRELLTNTTWGGKIPEEELDEESFLVAAETCYAERLGASFTNEGNFNVKALFQLMKDYVNCAVYEGDDDNKIFIKLIRNDYDVDKIRKLDDTHIGTLSGYQRNYNAEPVSTFTVAYKDHLNERQTVTVAAPNFTKHAAELSGSFDCCPNEQTALRIATRELIEANNTPLTLTITLDHATGQDLGIGEPISLSWVLYDINNMVMRVVGKDLRQDNTYSVKLTQDLFADLEQPLVGEQRDS